MGNVKDMKQKNFPEQMITALTEQLELHQQKLEAIEQKDTKALLEAKYQLTKNEIELTQRGEMSGSSLEVLNLKLTELQFFLNNPDIEYIEHLFYTTLPTSYYFSRLFSFTPIITLLVLTTVVLALYLTMDYREKNDDFQNTFPQKRLTLAGKKIGAMSLWILASWTIVIGILSLLITPKYGFGSLKRPFFYLNYQQQIHSITAGEYLLKTGISLIVLTLFLVTTLYVISALTKNTAATLTFGVILVLPVMMPRVLQAIPVKLLTYLPFGYLDLPDILLPNGAFDSFVTENRLTNFHPSWEQAVLYLLSFSAVCLLILIIKLQFERKRTIFHR